MNGNKRLLFLVLTIATALLALIVIHRKEQLKPYSVVSAQITSTSSINSVTVKKKETYSPYLRVSLDEAISRLSTCESNNNPKAQIVDSNDYYSRGILQFQYFTFRKYGIQYGLITSTTTFSEAVNDMFNPNIEIALAKKILQQPYGWTNWEICSKRENIVK